MKLDIIIPVCNKEKNILSTYEKINEELKDIKHKFIFIDNCSNDKTLEVLSTIQNNDEDNVKVISLSKCDNTNSSVVLGMKYSDADYICVYDTELNHSVSYIKKMLNYLIEHKNYDSICICKKIRRINKITKYICNTINKYFNLINIDGKTNYRLFNKRMVTSIIEYSKSNSITDTLFDDLGFKIYYDKIKSIEESKIKIIIPDYLKLILLIIIIGIVSTIASIIYILLSLICCSITIYTTIIFLLLFLAGTNFIIIGIMSNKVFKHINRKEPSYIIKDKFGFDEKML